jgi:serine/threonine-protein kinase
MWACPKCQATYLDDTGFCPRDGTPQPAPQAATAAALASGLARRYRVLHRLGKGGMGTVFLAEQIALDNRPVALKVLLRKLLHDPAFLLRFHDEAASIARLRHPNVITVYESGIADDGSPYIAMEYLKGETLRQALHARAFSVQQSVEIVQQAAQGLNAAHKLGIIHGDLKPENIFLTRNEAGVLVVKITDFGMAKLRESATGTLPGTALGTSAYMSFEQASGTPREGLSARSDVYSLGVVVYEMLTGCVPFQSDMPPGGVRKNELEEPPPFRAVAPGRLLSPEVERVVMKAVKKQREERYGSVLDFARALAAAAQPAAPVETKPPPAQTKVVSPPAARAEAPAPSPSRLGGGVGAPPAPTPALAAADAAVQTPPPTPAREIPRPLKAQPEVAEPAPPVISPPFVAGPAQLRSAVGHRSRGKFLVLGLLVALIAIVALWSLSRLGEQHQKRPTGQPSEARKSVSQPAPSGAPPGMVAIPGGTFMMGRDNAEDPEETPAHSVAVAPFYLDLTPVTRGEYARVQVDSSWPATAVSWNDAQAYCQSIGKRLPSEAEWEHAARGTDGSLYPWGNEFDATATNSIEAGLRHLIAVGTLPKNKSPFGVLDMSGNIWEWTADNYKPYPGHPATFEIPADGKVIRGGSYQSDKLHATTTTRNLDHASARSPVIGFRCAKSM